ncbi:hypothetical protein AMS68_004021 [Peltaster fructicola]|uniref:Probable transporter MCH1 n=1 Tax=Peltaster fructicola TaxID=286661 RepID=A0A6H0XUU6_9PEZI|nr:hypothetical protein AMS68_004021 [Peltaster fructicola]
MAVRKDRPGSSSSSRHRKAPSAPGEIDKLDYHPGGRLLQPHPDEEPLPRTSQETSYAGSFFEHVAEGVVDKDRAKMRQESVRYLSFAWAIINCLCAGSITAYSLYAPLFQKRLHYSQLQVNGVSITAELAMYLPVPIFGVLCDRYGPGPCSVLSGILFGVGYVLAAFTYRSGPAPAVGGEGWPYAVMILSFIPIGMATSCMYLAAVTTCAKNFGRGKFKGLALAIPIASFGLSGMWQSQVGTNLLYEIRPDGSKGPVDVFRYFIFLGGLFCVVGVIGFFTLKIVGEDELIDEAVEELEQSGLLSESEFYRRGNTTSYGTIDEEAMDDDALSKSHLLQKDEERRKKTWLLNEETRRFLGDHNMWLLAAGFFMVTGPGEAFINNLGTIIDTLYTPDQLPAGGNPTDATTHISIVAITSTVARILTGTLTDLFAPTTPQHQHRRGPNSLANSLASLTEVQQPRRFELSRMVFLIAFSVLCSIGQLILATGVVQTRAELFWLVSASIGAGYGAIFSLTPIIISVVYGVENFGTNWGIVATVPAISATIWGLIYSGVYQKAASAASAILTATESDALCYGSRCYAPTFWAMAVSVWIACALWLFAWRGPDGWLRRGIAV